MHYLIGKLMDEQRRIEELEAQVETLKRQLQAANETIENLRKAQSKQLRHQHDYLDYEDDRR